MIFSVHPNDIVTQTASGTGDMGDVADPKSIARFSLDEVAGKTIQRYVLCFIRGKATGGTGASDLAVMVSHRSSSDLFRFQLITIASFGIGSGFQTDINVLVRPEELFHFVFFRCPTTNQLDQLVFQWTNPDPGNMRWAIEVGLVDADSIV